ncbi:hypothetical protein [Listeria newyorkensis]|uniref:Uncharacterized protein n=1 Tax=Listeria newyorkensis TaxID=1497681 RepID=A0A841Z0F2_9LIST|nr:hypothetical protein [Listeria newyorkensis]MBC1459244.1 hypothetical protein [Listeria newyorkensis]
MKVLIIVLYILLALMVILSYILGWVSESVFGAGVVITIIFGLFMRFYLKRGREAQ